MVATDSLAIGVVVGSVTAMVIFAKRVAHLAHVHRVLDPDGTTVVHPAPAHRLAGPLRLLEQLGGRSAAPGHHGCARTME
nr:MULTISPECIES: hypothetical protein [unclassified Streptomyces]